MRKSLLILGMSVGISLYTAAQKLAISKVPAVVKESFSKQHPGRAAKWEMEKPNYEANFIEHGKPTSVLIDAKGKVIETETDIRVADLPAAILQYVDRHYKGKVIKEAAMITRAGNSIQYEAEVGGKDLVFDAEGHLLK